MLHSRREDDDLSTGCYAVTSSCSKDYYYYYYYASAYLSPPHNQKIFISTQISRPPLRQDLSIKCTVTSWPITSCCCVSGLTAATQRCLGGSDCGRRRSGLPWPASWWFYRWCTGSPPGLSWFCGECSNGRRCRTRSNVVCRPGCSCSSCRRGARPCRSAPPSGTCRLSADRRKLWCFFNEENSKTVK